MKHIVFAVFILFAIVIVATPAFADTPCTPMYGGGLKADNTPYCMEDVMAMQSGSTNAGDVDQSPLGTINQTKGGLSVQNAPRMNKQPATGPETTALVALPFLAMAGWYLRRSSRGGSAFGGKTTASSAL